MTRTVCIEGNIGSGKSSVLEYLSVLGYSTKQEPVDEWGEMLQLYYTDPTTWSLAFNLKVLHSFQQIPPGDVVVVERSPGACRHVFGQLAYNDEHMNPASWSVFKGFHDRLSWEPEMYIYVDTPVQTCFERMQSRGRQCEQGITEEYLRRIEFQYQNFLKFTSVPVHRVDGKQSVTDVALEIIRIVNA